MASPARRRCADLPRAVLVHRLERAGQQQHRDVREVRPALDERGNVVAAPLGHADVGQHDVGSLNGNARDRLLAISDGYDLHVLSGERQLDDALNGHAVVGEQELMCASVEPLMTRLTGSGRCWLMKSTISCIGVPGRKMPRMPISFSFGTSTSGMMPPTTTSTSQSVLASSSIDPRADVHVRARQDRQADDVGVLLQRGGDDLLRRLAQPV